MAAVKEYDLTIAEQTVNITGKPVERITVNGKFVAPLLEFEEGDEAVIRVHNKLKIRTLQSIGMAYYYLELWMVYLDLTNLMALP